MAEIILSTVKHLLGVTDDYTVFDDQILIGVNAAFGVLHQLGFDSFTATNESTWDDFECNPKYLGMVQQYVFQKTRLMFDPPQNGSVKESMQNVINEFEWRLNAIVDPLESYGEEDSDGG